MVIQFPDLRLRTLLKLIKCSRSFYIGMRSVLLGVSRNALSKINYVKMLCLFFMHSVGWATINKIFFLLFKMLLLICTNEYFFL